MKAAAGHIAVFLALVVVVWAAMNSAGTDWSIPFAIAVVAVAGVLLRLSSPDRKRSRARRPDPWADEFTRRRRR